MQPKFRIRNKDIEKLRKINRSTQRKERRLSKLFNVTINNPLMKIEEFTTRKQFNQYIKELESFTDYNSHRYVKNAKGVVIERDLYNQINKSVKKLNKLNQKKLNEIKSMAHTDRGEETGWTVDDAMYKMGDPRLNRFRQRKFNFDAYSSKKDMMHYLARTQLSSDYKRNEFMDRMLRDNYKRALRNVFGNDALNIIKAINKLPLEMFLYKFYTENIADFDFIYSFQNRIVKLIALSYIWRVKPHLVERLEGLL